MAQDLVVPQFGALPPALATASFDVDELSGGIVGGFGVLSYRGRVWRVRYRGEEYNLINQETGDPLASVELVLVKSNAHLSKIYYPNGYTEGSGEKPSCWSNDGVNPDPLVPAPPAASCGLCEFNKFGSKITDNGKPVKACADSKRTVVVPLADMGNEAFGGPMLLRIPAASLGDLANFARQLKQAGYPYFGVATRLRFDIKEAFPKLVFSAIRLLTQEEAEYILSVRKDPQTIRILNEEPEAHSAGTEGEKSALFEQPPTAPAAAPAAAKPAPASAPAAKPAPASVPRAAAPVPVPAAAKAPTAPAAPPAGFKAAPVPTARAAPAAPKATPRAAPVSAIGAAIATPVKAAPRAAEPAAREEAPAQFEDALDEELAALLN